MPVAADETDESSRVASLDILRGIAILGILFMNINDMGQSMVASFGDIRHLGWTTADQAAWWLREVLANGTARGLLQLLFGAGMVILTDRAAAGADDDWDVLSGYWRRNILLFMIGLIHMFVLLWPGDILHSYAIAALIAVCFRRLAWRWLLSIGLTFAALHLVGGVVDYHDRTSQPVATASLETGRPAIDAQPETQPDAQTARDIAAEDAGRLGTTADWMRTQLGMSFRRLFSPGELFAIQESFAMMLIGAALFKLGILQGLRPRRFYLRFALVAYAVAVPLRLVGAWEQASQAPEPHIAWITAEAARLGMTLGHVALVHLLISTAVGARLLRPFQAAGRTALSIYIVQTLIGLWALYPPFALHLYRSQGWLELMLTALAIDAVLLIGAILWLRHFRIAPVEWAWRSIAAGRALPIRRRPLVGRDVSAAA